MNPITFLATAIMVMCKWTLQTTWLQIKLYM